MTSNSLFVRIVNNIIRESKLLIDISQSSVYRIQNVQQFFLHKQKIKSQFTLLYFYFLDPRNQGNNLAFRDHKHNVLKSMAKRINKLRKHFVIKTLEDGKCLKTKEFLETYITLYFLPREVTQKIMAYVPIERNSIIKTERYPLVRTLIRNSSSYLKNKWRVYVKEIFDCVPESQKFEFVEFIFTYKREKMRDVFVRSLMME